MLRNFAIKIRSVRLFLVHYQLELIESFLLNHMLIETIMRTKCVIFTKVSPIVLFYL